METTKCRKCNQSKNITEFYKSDKNNCKECIKAKARKYREENIDKVREYDRNRPNHKNRVSINKKRAKLKRESSPEWKPRTKQTKEELAEYKAKYYQENKERLLIVNKQWAVDNLESRRKHAREWGRRNREACNKNTKIWREKNNHKTRAHDKIKYATRKKRISKPLLCEHCNKKGQLHGHHHDYAKPLDVTWLCPICHSAEHKRLNELKRKAKS